MAAKREGGASGRDGEFGVNRCKLLHLDWINNLLDSTGNDIQSPGTDHDGKQYKKECLRMHDFAVWQKLIHHGQSTILE